MDVRVSHYGFTVKLIPCTMNAGVRTAFKNIRGKVTKGSLNIAKLAIFWAGVFVAARYILESN